MVVSTINRFARGMDYPSLVGPGEGGVNLVYDVAAPGSAAQNKSYGMSGLGDVIADITTGNFASLPTDFINGLNPATFDIGSYAIVGLVLFLVMGGMKGGKSGSRRASRKAKLTGQIAQDQALLKS
jgi:hypothetical protein